MGERERERLGEVKRRADELADAGTVGDQLWCYAVALEDRARGVVDGAYVEQKNLLMRERARVLTRAQWLLRVAGRIRAEARLAAMVEAAAPHVEQGYAAAEELVRNAATALGVLGLGEADSVNAVVAMIHQRNERGGGFGKLRVADPDACAAGIVAAFRSHPVE